MIQIYTGNGKGKTTAALGLALRASGAGLKVYIGQFIKNGGYNEIKALKKIKNIKVEQYGRGCFIGKNPEKKDLELARAGLEKARKALKKKIYRIIILDEINVALKFKLLKLEEIMRLIKSVPKKIELILTGRYAHPAVIRAADLVSEIKDIKHYYNDGHPARRGIEK